MRTNTSLNRKNYVNFISRSPTVTLNVSRRELEKALETFSVTVSSFSFREDIVTFLNVSLPQTLPILQHGYGFKGGAARKALAHHLGLPNWYREVRDLDIVRLGDAWREEDSRISAQFMPEDWRYGHGVELTRCRKSYLSSRDLTINQVAFLKDTLFLTPLCLLDTLSQVLRPASYRAGTLHRAPTLSGRTVTKILRFQAEFGDEWTIAGLPEQLAVRPSEIALHLDRALHRGLSVTEKYLKLCERQGLIHFYGIKLDDVLEEVVEELLPELEGGVTFFRHLPEEIRTRFLDDV
jgi:hypothetical protein